MRLICAFNSSLIIIIFARFAGIEDKCWVAVVLVLKLLEVIIRELFCAANFSKFRRPICQFPQLTVADFPCIAINLLWTPEPDQLCGICRQQPQLIDTVCLLDKMAVFQISSIFSIFRLLELEWHTCLHIEINFLLLSEVNQNMPFSSPYMASTIFRNSPWKVRNSAETGTFHGSAQNFGLHGKLCSLMILDDTISCSDRGWYS